MQPCELLFLLTCGAPDSCLTPGLLVSAEAALHGRSSRQQEAETRSSSIYTPASQRAAAEPPRPQTLMGDAPPITFPSVIASIVAIAIFPACDTVDALAFISWDRSKSELLTKHFSRFITNYTSNTSCYANEVANYSQTWIPSWLLNAHIVTYNMKYFAKWADFPR